jgi:hypothetical protein
MTFSDRLIAAMGNKGFRNLGELSPQGLTFEGMGNKKRVVVQLPEMPPGDPDAVCFALVLDAMRRVAEQP